MDYEWWMRMGEPETAALLADTGWTPERWRKHLLDTVYVEPPVSMREFLLSPDYANYAKDLWPNVQALLEEFDKSRYREAHFGLGKGSGKSSIGAIFLSRAVYWLMNLRDPWTFYSLRRNTLLNVLNVSVSGLQAQSVIFDTLVDLVENSKYFKGKFTKRVSLGHADLTFPGKRIRAISGHSGSTVWRGYAIYAGVADEASWFLSKANKDNAEEVCDVMRGCMKTRFANKYKLLVISSLKARNDFLCKTLLSLRKEALQKDKKIEQIEHLREELKIPGK